MLDESANLLVENQHTFDAQMKALKSSQEGG